MGNLQNKYTDEEWEKLFMNKLSSARCITLTDEDISESEFIARQIGNNKSWELDLNSPITNLVKALKKDSEYYESWKANIAMAFKDEYARQSYKVDDDRLNGFLTEIDIHGLANNAADNFLRQLIS